MHAARTRKTPELLAPAGGPDALRAAVNNGADAVYLGVGDLNARRGAENFDLEGLARACGYAHLHSVRVYLTANIVVLQSEMQAALDLIDEAWVAGVDAVIVQDLGLIRCLRETLPHVRLHASTQIGTHNTATALELARLGVARVTLARETTIEEIAVIAADGGLEVESFVHGALCFCYSGQCLMSSLIGERSGNRGLCAQPCRMAYELIDGAGAVLAAPGAHLLSPRDLCGIDLLPRLVRAGVAALKIEGRMKEPEYVALVTGVYRAALDRAVADLESFRVTETEHAILGEAFNRGFSSAYLEGIRDNRMMSYSRPNNRGVPLGRVTQVTGAGVTVALDASLDAEDTIEFWTNRGRFAQRAGELRLRGARVMHAPAGVRVELSAEKSASVGDRVFRVANAALIDAARRTFAEDAAAGSLGLDVHVRIVVGEPLRVRVFDGAHAGEATGDSVEPARTKSVAAEEITEHVGRLGGTPYRVNAWDIELEPGAGVGFSQLHRTRREALENYEVAVLGSWARRTPVRPAAPTLARRKGSVRATPEIVAWCVDTETAHACLAAGADRAFVPAWVPAEPRAAASGTSGPDAAGAIAPGLGIEVPRVVHDPEATGYIAAALAAGRSVVGNLGLVRAVADTGAFAEAHWGLNAVNSWSVEALRELGARFVWLSPELSEQQIGAIVATTTVPLGTAVYGRQEIMVAEHCVLMAAGECSRECASCARRRETHELRDAKGYRFPVATDPAGRSHVFNSVPLDLSHALEQVAATGVSAVRLDFSSESAEEARAIVQRFARILVGGEQGRGGRRSSTTTSGHFFRGVR